MTDLRYVGPDATKKAPLWERYERQTREQPAFLELDPENGRVKFGVNPEVGPPHGVPADVWHGVRMRWGAPSTLTGQACVDLFEELRPLLERVAAGHSVVWNGSNHVGRLTDDAQAASEAIEETLYKLRDDPTSADHASVWNAGEWIWGSNSLHGVAGDLEITADTSDADLEALATKLEGDADGEGIVLDGDVEDALADIRQQLRDERAAEAGDEDEDEDA